MKIGLLDVDGHHYPNLALMRISTFHKSEGDEVAWWNPIEHFDVLYKSKVFSDTYSKDIPDPLNADVTIRGGTGYAIHLDNGVETFDSDIHEDLPDYIESLPPDYTIYPQHDFAISMTSRGCPRGCLFCHVGCKEGLNARKVADVDLFYKGQDLIQVLDPNILACPDRVELLRQYKDTGAKLSFTQGLDVRYIDDQVMEIINGMRVSSGGIHMAWDNPNEDLEPKLREFARNFRLKKKGMVYVLTNFGSTIEQDLDRIYKIRDMGYWPYVMIYNKPYAPREIRLLQRWCNNKFVFAKCPRFEDYNRHKA